MDEMDEWYTKWKGTNWDMKIDDRMDILTRKNAEREGVTKWKVRFCST